MGLISTTRGGSVAIASPPEGDIGDLLRHRSIPEVSELEIL